MKTYVYGLIDGGAAVPDGLTGIEGASVRIAPAGGFYAVVSDFPGSTLVADRANLLKHEEVLETILEQITPLPFRFGAIVTMEQLTGFAGQFSATLREDLDQVRGCVQMSAKLALKAAPPLYGDHDGPGRRFLREKLAQRAAVEAAAEWLHAGLAELVRARQISVHAGSSPRGSIAHLVEKPQVEAYRARFREVSSSRPDVSWLQTGPWPPYSFVRAGVRKPGIGAKPMQGLQYGRG